MIYVTAGGPSIVIDGFSNKEDCALVGQLNIQQVNPRAKYRCYQE